jgi:YHS domain-containing protein
VATRLGQSLFGLKGVPPLPNPGKIHACAYLATPTKGKAEAAMRRVQSLAVLLSLGLGAGLSGTFASPGLDDVPEAFAPFDYLIGGWKGAAVPQANRLKGWQETHRWAWKFAKGTPVGMSLTLENDKILRQGDLSFEAASKTYRLQGASPDGKALSYSGKLDASGRVLTLIREGTVEGATERLTLRPNSEKIRYTLMIERQDSGAPQFAKYIEIGVTKEGEAFASGGAAADLPKCIVTGGAASMTVSYEGKTYSLCCSGCRDEFNENPAKYVKKALLRAQAGSEKSTVKPATTTRKDDGAFDGLVDDPKPKTKDMAKPKASAPKDETKDEPVAETKSPAKPSSKTSDPATRAAGLLAQARALEKSGKSDAAVVYYRRITKEFAETPSAKTAAERIKALQK